MWPWLSTPPGSTSLPRASISLLALVEPFGRSPRPSSPRMPTSALKLSVAVATVPPRITQIEGLHAGLSCHSGAVEAELGIHSRGRSHCTAGVHAEQCVMDPSSRCGTPGMTVENSWPARASASINPNSNEAVTRGHRRRAGAAALRRRAGDRVLDAGRRARSASRRRSTSKASPCRCGGWSSPTTPAMPS